MSEDCRFKQALIVRQDVKMGLGKIVVQCCHASLTSAEETRSRFPEWLKAWVEEGQCKIVLKVRGLETILALAKRAEINALPCYLVRDRGLTQVEPGTITCLGIGPVPADRLNPLTGDLALL